MVELVVQALRRLRRNMPSTLLASSALAIGLGAAATMSTIVDSFLLSALPYADSDRLVMIWNYRPEAPGQDAVTELPLSPGVFVDLWEGSSSFERLAAFLPESVTLREPEEASRAHSLLVTGEFFRLLGRDAAIGRVLGPRDARPGAPPAVVISHAFWQNRFGGADSVLGEHLHFGGRAHRIVGVMGPDFRFTEGLVDSPGLSKQVDLWVPFDPTSHRDVRGFHYLTTIGLLEENRTLSAAREELASYSATAARTFPDTDGQYRLELIPLREQLFGHLRPALWTLWGVALLILVIACANVSTLLLARQELDRGATSLRLALGATRYRIFGESLLESLVLGLIAWPVALGVGSASVTWLSLMSPAQVFQNYPPRIDGRTALVALALSLGAGFLCGCWPALRASRADTRANLVREASRLTRRSRRSFWLLVATQLALATVLLVGVGLAFRSFHSLVHMDMGIRAGNLVTFDLHLPHSPYRDTSQKTAFLSQLLERLEALPGAEAVAMNYALPLSGVNASNGFRLEGRAVEGEETLSANLGLVNSGYFEALGIPLLDGRMFDARDTAEAPKVAIVDQRMVRRHFSGIDPLGQQIRIAGEEPRTIVGVAGAIQQTPLEQASRPNVYLPYQQLSYMFTRIAVRTSLEEPLDLVPAIRRTVRALDDTVPVGEWTTFADSFREALAPQRLNLLLMSVFAGTAMFLAMVGVYGVMTFLMRQRRAEAGIRLAVGAAPKHVLALVLKQGLALSSAGTLLGVSLAVGGWQVLTHLAHGAAPLDYLVLSLAPLVILVASFISYAPPALRLSRVDPAKSLRSC